MGRRPVALPADVTVELVGGALHVRGPRGELRRPVPPAISLRVGREQVVVEQGSNERQARALHGTVRAHLANMVRGVSAGFRRELEIVGVGYRAELDGRTLRLALGHSHPEVFDLPDGVSAQVDRARVVLASHDRDLLGQTAARLRALRPPEPYKGKGVRYAGEAVRRKPGKAAAGAKGAGQ